jgi:signal transduction histidine kinase
MMVKGLRPAIFQTFPTDSVSWTGQMQTNHSGDSIKEFHLEVQRIQKSPTKIEMINPDSNKQIRIITSGKPLNIDSLRATLRPMMQKLDTLASANSFIFRMNEQSIDTESINKKFNEKLEENGYPMESKIRKAMRLGDFDSLANDVLILDEIPIPPGMRIQAYFENLGGYFFKKMLPPVLFAILVIALISASLIMMYRNMLKQQKLNLLKNDIISNITHELKTPIATVSVVLESLQNFGANENPATKDEYIQIAKNELKRLTSMTENILKSSVLGSNQSENLSQLDLSNLLVENLNTFKPILDSKGFEFSWEEKGTNFTVNGNAEQLSLVIFNLMDNAIKYSKERFYIKVSLVEDIKSIVLKIEDKGIGIPESYQNDIFDKFIRVPQQDVHDVRGYGLGLAQVAEIVRLHKGKIMLESQLGKGSTFTIQLPKV